MRFATPLLLLLPLVTTPPHLRRCRVTRVGLARNLEGPVAPCVWTPARLVNPPGSECTPRLPVKAEMRQQGREDPTCRISKRLVLVSVSVSSVWLRLPLRIQQRGSDADTASQTRESTARHSVLHSADLFTALVSACACTPVNKGGNSPPWG
jgi:hypothetical protein